MIPDLDERIEEVNTLLLGLFKILVQSEGLGGISQVLHAFLDGFLGCVLTPVIHVPGCFLSAHLLLVFLDKWFINGIYRAGKKLFVFGKIFLL